MLDSQGKKVVSLLFAVIILLSCVVVYQFVEPQEVKGEEHQVLGLSVSPSGSTFKLGVNQSKTFTAQALNGTGPYSFSWEIIPSASLTLRVNEETLQLTDKLVVEGSALTLCFPEATVEFVTVVLSGTDVNGLAGEADSFVVADPYTSPGYYFDASTANYDYIIQNDEVGWVRIINGETGGVVSSSTDVSTLLNTVLSGGNVSVFVNKGEYTTTSQIVVYGNSSVVGDDAVFIRDASHTSTSMFAVSGENIILNGLIIDGQDIGSHLIYSALFENLKIVNCRLYNCPEFPVWVRGTDSTTKSDGLWIENCKITDCIKTAIQVRYTDNIFISKNYVDTGREGAIPNYGAVYIWSDCNNAEVTGNYLNGGEYGCAVGEYTDTVNNTNIVVSNNIIEGSYYGIYGNLDYGKFSGNIIKNCTYGVFVYEVAEGKEYVTISDNTISNCTIGVRLMGVLAQNTNYCKVSDNTITATTGIMVSIYSGYNQITNNMIKATQHGIDVAWHYNVIRGNSIFFDWEGTGSYCGVTVTMNQGTGTVIQNNYFRTVDGGGYCILLNYGCNNALIQNNEVNGTYGNATKISLNPSLTGCLVTDNMGFTP